MKKTPSGKESAVALPKSDDNLLIEQFGEKRATKILMIALALRNERLERVQEIRRTS